MLKHMEKTISMSELEADPEKVAKDIRASGTVYRIRRRGRAPVLLSKIPEWAAVVDCMMQPGWREQLEESDRELAAGGGRELGEVLTELGLAGRVEQARRGATRSASGNRRPKSRSSSTRARGRSSKR
jgi:hypothetical protein